MMNDYREWDGTIYRYSGEWEDVQLGGRRCAARNRKTVYAPIYRSEDGRVLLMMKLAKQKPEID